jgi:hypothetical protein
MGITFKGVDLIEVGKYVDLKVTGKLEAADYDLFIPALEEQIKEHGKINMMVELIDFKGWTAGAAWEDAKFGLKHFNDIDRLVIVGDKAWEKGMAFFCKAFTTAKVRYFDVSERDEAFAWLVHV